jgi:glycosyltransferase involved in cell wall biosynthesis
MGNPPPEPKKRPAAPVRSPAYTVREARAALRAGDADRALALVDEVLGKAPNDVGANTVRWRILERRGDLTGALACIDRIKSVGPITTEVQAGERRLTGHLVETEDNWLPRVPGPASRLEPDDPAIVLHLLKQSLPQVETGYAMRSQYSLLAQRSAGLRPAVVTSLGFPRRVMSEAAQEVTVIPEVELVDGIEHYRLDLGLGYGYDERPDINLRDQARLTATIVEQLRPAIVHAGSGYRGYELALVALALRERFAIPVVYEVRGFLEGTWSPDRRLARAGNDGSAVELTSRRAATELRCMRAADVVITIADAMRDEIVDRGVPPERVHVVPNGVDPSVFTPRPADPALRRSYGIPDEVPVFGYVSTLDHPRENHELLIATAAALASAQREAVCLIVGDGKRRAELERAAEASGVLGRVIFTGRVPHDRVADLYALLDVFVVPRRDDRAARYVTPLKPFEAMAMERPLVVTDLPALTELAAPNGSRPRGLVVPLDDAAAMASALERLFDDPDLRRKLGSAGREWVVRERTWEANGKRYLAAYETVRSRAGVGGAQPTL